MLQLVIAILEVAAKLWTHVLIQRELAKRPKGNILVRPDLGKIKDIPPELLSIGRIENLYITNPGWVIIVLYRVEQILSMPVRILGSHLGGFGVGEVFDALIGLAVNLNILKCAIWLGELVSVARVTIHHTVRVWGTAITEELHDLMNRLLVGGKVIPKHSGVFEVGLRIAFLSMNE